MRTIVLVAIVIALTFTASALKVANDEHVNETWAQWLCRQSPDLCDINNVADIIQNRGGRSALLRRVAFAFFDNYVRYTVDEVSDVVSLSDTQRRDLHRRMQKEPHDTAAAMRALVNKHRPELLRYEAPSGNLTSPPYFGFVPKYYGNIPIAAPSPTGFHIDTKCYHNVAVSAKYDSSRESVEVTVTTANSTGVLLCEDRFFFTIGGAKVDLEIMTAGTHTATILVPGVESVAAAKWDLETNGVRVFRYDRSKIARSIDTLDTLLLFLPEITGKLDEKTAIANIDFLSNFSLMTPYPVPRKYKGIVDINPDTDLRNGDLFAKMDLNGLGPMEMLGQGTNSGHVAFVLKNESTGVANVCESIPQGITCTVYTTWIQEMQAKGASIAYVPLKDELSQKFNTKAAWKWVIDNYGNEYGYHNFFFGWIDTENDNYPCFPWTWDRCLGTPIIEVFLHHVEAVLPELTNLVATDALNHRAGTSGLNLTEVFYQGFLRKKMTASQLFTVVEQDSWKYNATRRGHKGTFMLPSQTCSTLGCNILREGGVFDSINGTLQCAEQDPWDIFSMDIFETKKFGAGRPQACINADPDNYLCQLSGNWTFYLQRNVNERELFVNMGNDCATKNPAPYNHKGCYKPKE